MNADCGMGTNLPKNQWAYPESQANPKALFRVAEFSRIKSIIVQMIAFLSDGKRGISDDVILFLDY